MSNLKLKPLEQSKNNINIINKQNKILLQTTSNDKWKNVRLKDISENVSYGYTARANIKPIGLKFLRITDIRGGTVDWQNVPYCIVEDREIHKYILKKGDIVIARTGNSTGESYLFDSLEKAVFASYLVRFRIDPTKANPHFIYYNLKSNSWREFVNGAKTGSAQAGANARILESFKLKLPNLDTQKSIVDILSILDNKIELNYQMNKVLEEIACTMFKSWFIDFEPIMAKMEGLKPPGLSDEIAVLFPQKIVDNKPKGWLERSVYSYAKYINGAAHKSKHFTNPKNALPIVKIAELKEGLGQGTKYTNMDLGSQCHIDNGEILFSWSGNPETSIDIFLWVGGAAYLNQHIFKIVTESSETRAYVYFMLKQLKPLFILLAKNKQTTGLGHITIGDLKRLKIIYPSLEVLTAFSKCAEPILSSIERNLKQITTLKDLKNSLLPKLISGELQISEINLFCRESL